MKKIRNAIILQLIVLITLSSFCFAGSWQKQKFQSYISPYTTYSTPVIVATGTPHIRFNIYNARIGDKIKVEMQRKEYDPVQYEWIFQTIDEYTQTISSSNDQILYYPFKDAHNRECRFLIKSSSAAIFVDGYIEYGEVN